MFAGCSEAAGPVDIDCCNSELVPSAGSDVSQLDALLCGLRDRWGWGGVESKPEGIRVYVGSQPRLHIFAATSVICVLLVAKRSTTPSVRNAQQFYSCRMTHAGLSEAVTSV